MATVEPYLLKDGSRRYRVRYRTPGHQQTDKRGFKTKREAELYGASVEVSKARGEFISVAAGTTTVAAWADKWMDGWSELTPSTASRYRGIVRTHVLPRWGTTPLSALTKSDIKSWLAGLVRNGSSAATARKVHSVLSCILTVAVDDKMLAFNPAIGVKVAKPTVTPRRYLTHQEVDSLAEAAGERGRSIILMLAYCGLRWGELAALRVHNVSIARSRIHIEASVTEVNGKMEWGDTKTRQKRGVPVPAFLLPMLAEQTTGKKPTDLAFPAPGGGVLRYRAARVSWFNAAVAGSGIAPAFHPHELRHTAASLAISAGANVMAVQRMLGHASAKMTLDTYADLFPDDLDAVAISLDQARTRAVVGTDVGTEPSMVELRIG